MFEELLILTEDETIKPILDTYNCGIVLDDRGASDSSDYGI